MVASLAKIAFGSTFTWDGAPIAELTKIGGVKLSAKTSDITSFDSDDAYEEVIPTILNGNSFDIEGLLIVGDTLGQVAMLADFHAKSLKAWIIAYPTAVAASWTGNGYLTAFEMGDANFDGVLTFKATIQNTGKPSLGITASTGGTFTVTGNNGAAVVNPASAAGVYEYVANLVAGAVSYQVTPTCAAGVITLIDSLGNSQTIISTNLSTVIACTANGMQNIKLINTETGKAPTTYVIHVVEPV